MEYTLQTTNLAQVGAFLEEDAEDVMLKYMQFLYELTTYIKIKQYKPNTRPVGVPERKR